MAEDAFIRLIFGAAGCRVEYKTTGASENTVRFATPPTRWLSNITFITILNACIYIHIKIHQAVRRRYRDIAAEGRVLTNAKHACLHDLSRAHIIIICASVHTRRAHDRDTCTFYIEINRTARGRRYTSSGYKRRAQRLDEEGDGGGCVH